MKIAKIEHLQIESHRFLLVRVTTDEGVVGIGESSGLTGARQWVDRFRGLLVGEDLFAVQRHVTQMLWGKQEGHFLTYEGDEVPVEEWLVRYGAAGASLSHAATRAAAAIEMALLDAIGKTLGTPVYNLLGGKFRDRVPIYLDLAGSESDDPKAWREVGERSAGHGFGMVKFDVDYAVPKLHRDPWNRSVSTNELMATVKLMEAVREGLGWDVELAVDCHGQYNTTDAIRMGQALEDVKLIWMEDPMPDYHPDAFVRVREATKTPIAAGELMQTLFEHRGFIDAGAVDILHPDVRMVGGLLEYKRVADYADAHYIPVASHSGASPYGTIAMAHGAAAVRSFLYQEYHWFKMDWISELVNIEGPLFVDGAVQLSDAPGYGVEINEELWLQKSAAGWL
jgi:L-alanine-DL-glutamate epimerase-like enolase superfamily enzyme